MSPWKDSDRTPPPMCAGWSGASIGYCDPATGTRPCSDPRDSWAKVGGGVYCLGVNAPSGGVICPSGTSPFFTGSTAAEWRDSSCMNLEGPTELCAAFHLSSRKAPHQRKAANRKNSTLMETMVTDSAVRSHDGVSSVWKYCERQSHKQG